MLLQEGLIADTGEMARLPGLHNRSPMPQLLRGAAAGWPAMARWSVERLATCYGDRQVAVAATPERRVVDDAGARLPRLTMPLRDYVAQHTGDRASRSADYYYLSKCRIADLDARLKEDIFCGWPEPVRGQAYFVWLSPAGAITPLHWDLPDNCFAQIAGRKRFRIYRPRPRGRFYPYARTSGARHVSRVDAESPDRALYPQFPSEPDLDIVLNPGDILQLPSRWWHHVESLEQSISVNRWSAPSWRAWRPDVLVGDACAAVAIKVRQHRGYTRK
jgi:hypothetical protein